jgi:hypothetical protein
MALAALLAVAAPGCYDRDAIVEARHEETKLVPLKEIDVGEFRITLPHSPGAPGGGVVEFHAFGQVAARDSDDVAGALALNAPELRYRVLLLVRSLTRQELDEPTLTTLRAGIAEVANSALDKKRIKNIGFYRFSFTTL